MYVDCPPRSEYRLCEERSEHTTYLRKEKRRKKSCVSLQVDECVQIDRHGDGSWIGISGGAGHGMRHPRAEANM